MGKDKLNKVFPENNPDDSSKKKRCKFCSRRVLAYFFTWNSPWQMVVLIAVLSIYVFAGAAVFVRIEGPYEHQRIREAVENRSELASIREHLIGNLTASGTLSREEALSLFYTIRNITVAEASLDLSRNWEFGPAIFFVTTLITTVGKPHHKVFKTVLFYYFTVVMLATGYGSIAPKTHEGRIFLIFYAMGGIPIALVFLASLGKMFDKLLDLSIQLLGKNMSKRRVVKIVALILSSLLGICLFIFLPCIAFNSLEPWDYFESVYFSFVTLTTIGFGDYVPSQTTGTVDGADPLHGFYRFCTAIWIWVGLAFVSLLINRIQNTFTIIGDTLHVGWVMIKERRKVKQETASNDEQLTERSSELVMTESFGDIITEF